MYESVPLSEADESDVPESPTHEQAGHVSNPSGYYSVHGDPVQAPSRRTVSPQERPGVCLNGSGGSGLGLGGSDGSNGMPAVGGAPINPVSTAIYARVPSCDARSPAFV